MDILIKDAKEKEKKDMKGKGTGGTFWRSVAGVVHSVESGLRNQAAERHTAGELELRIGKYVGRALGNTTGLGCGCHCEDAEDEAARVKAEKGKERQGYCEERPIFCEPKYRLSIPATVATDSSLGRYSAIDQDRRMGAVVPVMENWPLKA